MLWNDTITTFHLRYNLPKFGNDTLFDLVDPSPSPGSNFLMLWNHTIISFHLRYNMPLLGNYLFFDPVNLFPPPGVTKEHIFLCCVISSLPSFHWDTIWKKTYFVPRWPFPHPPGRGGRNLKKNMICFVFFIKRYICSFVSKY